MKYNLSAKILDQNILTEILQNRFCRFDHSVVKWKFNDKSINSNELEKKLIKNYKFSITCLQNLPGCLPVDKNVFICVLSCHHAASRTGNQPVPGYQVCQWPKD